MNIEIRQETVTDEETDEKTELSIFCSYLKTLRDNGVRQPKKKGPQELGFHPGFSCVLDEIDAKKLTWSDVLDPSKGHEGIRQELLKLKPEDLWGMSTDDGLAAVMARIDARYSSQRSHQKVMGERTLGRRLGRLSLESQ